MRDPTIRVNRSFHSARADNRGDLVKVIVYEFHVGRHGPFREEFFANEQTEETINARLNKHALLLRSTGALEPEGT